ncbi:MAG TPA: aminotransferase class V-fold PLP-dependent enzyme [Moheibacter sp.]|nr:aminotransferase class V-fold PLP-dependent enzyme [Moheibacter sp.]
MKDVFLLRDDITFLNFGSFGACPKPVFEVYQKFQLELEQEPVEFMVDKAPAYLKNSRIALGNYLNCDADDLVCITNPSYGVNIVAKSLELNPGDEILTTNLEYGACDRTWKYYCEKSGAKYIQHPIRFPLESKEDFIEQFKKGISSKTKLIFISHITSSTALRLPVKEISKLAKENGIPFFIDGAHAPAQVEVNLQKLDCDYYVGSCHKWMMAPKGSSFLYVKKEFQNELDPLVVSWGFDSDFPSHSRFLDYHEMQGTRDLSAFCTIPATIDFMEKHNWKKVSEDCKKLTQENALQLCEILGKKPIAPIHDDFVAQMFSSEIDCNNPKELHDRLFHEFKIQIPVMPHGNKVFLRYSISAFNSQEDLNKLFSVLRKIS